MKLLCDLLKVILATILLTLAIILVLGFIYLLRVGFTPPDVENQDCSKVPVEIRWEDC